MSENLSVFYINPMRRIAPAALCVFFALFLLFAGFLFENGSKEESTGALFVSLLLLICALLLWVLCSYPQIVITEKHITHRQLGYRIQSNWENVDALVEQHGKIYLILRQSGGTNSLLKMSLKLFPDSLSIVDRPDLLSEGRLIDLTPFSHYWHDGSLKKLVETHLSN